MVNRHYNHCQHSLQLLARLRQSSLVRRQRYLVAHTQAPNHKVVQQACILIFEGL